MAQHGHSAKGHRTPPTMLLHSGHSNTHCWVGGTPPIISGSSRLPDILNYDNDIKLFGKSSRKKKGIFTVRLTVRVDPPLKNPEQCVIVICFAKEFCIGTLFVWVEDGRGFAETGIVPPNRILTPPTHPSLLHSTNGRYTGIRSIGCFDHACMYNKNGLNLHFFCDIVRLAEFLKTFLCGKMGW